MKNFKFDSLDNDQTQKVIKLTKTMRTAVINHESAAGAIFEYCTSLDCLLGKKQALQVINNQDFNTWILKNEKGA